MRRLNRWTGKTALAALAMSGFLLDAALPVSAVSTKTLWIEFTNPLQSAGITYQVTDDAVSGWVATEEIQGYSQSDTPLGRIGKAFFVFDAAKLGVQIALNGTYNVSNLQVADYRSPEVQNNTLKLAILILVQCSGPDVNLAYASVDVVVFLLTDKTLDDWTVEGIGATGSLASKFIDTLPAQFPGFESWIQVKAGEVWAAAQQASAEISGICGLAVLAPVPAVTFAYHRVLRHASRSARPKC